MNQIEQLTSEITAIEQEIIDSGIETPLKGAIRLKYVRCGKACCQCMHGGDEHGPYPHLQWWENGKIKTKYLNKKNYPVYKKLLENTKRLKKKKKELALAKRSQMDSPNQLSNNRNP